MLKFDSVALLPILLKNAVRNPDRTAIITPEVQISHTTLTERIQEIADWLIDQGFNPDEITAVTVPDEVAHIEITLALLCLGTPNISIGSFETQDNRTRIIDRLEISQTISPPDLPLHYSTAKDTQRLYPPANYSPSGSAHNRMMSQLLREEDEVIILSTSGTTGVPKIFGMSMARMMRVVGTTADNPSQRCVLRSSSVEHHSSRLQRIFSLFAGQTAAILQPVTADVLASFCTSAGVTEIHAGTYKLASLLSASPIPAHRLPVGVRIHSGGSRVPGSLRAAVMEQLTPNLYISFATSEVGVVSIAKPDEHTDWPEGVGHPLPGVEVELRAPDGTVVPRGTDGELWVRKHGIPGKGTVAQPDWVSTGDLLSWPEDGPLIFHARTDAMMILNGINIFPSLIEDVLTAHPAVSEAVTYPIPSAVHGQIPVAVVVLQPDATTSIAELMRHASNELGLQAPRRISIVEEIPRTELGKPLTHPSEIKGGYYPRLSHKNFTGFSD